MKKKIFCILFCTLLIITTLSAIGTTNVQTSEEVKENNYLEPYPSIPANSPDIITIKIVAKVLEVNDPDNLLDGTIKVNDTITGKYTYDSGATDINPDPTQGEYWYNSSPCGVEVEAGGFVFKTDPNNVDFIFYIFNDCIIPYYPGDLYGFDSLNNSNLSNGLQVRYFYWALYDNSGTAISSDTLPTTAPVLSKWNQSTAGYGLHIDGHDPSLEDFFAIEADVIKATRSRARDVHFITQPILQWLFERFPILKHLMGY